MHLNVLYILLAVAYAEAAIHALRKHEWHTASRDMVASGIYLGLALPSIELWPV